MLVGRGRHLDALRAVVDGGGLASVTGPFGIGKSALAAALVGERPAALVGQGLPALSGHAYHPLLHALGWGPRAVEPSAMASQVRDRLVGSDVLVLEDLQWADPGTLEVLVGLVGAAPIVVTLQSGESGTDRARRLLRSLGAREIALPPLDADAVDEIVAHLRPDLLRGERARIVEQSDGNPLAATVLAHAEGAEGPGDTARRGRRAEPGVTVAAYVGRRSAPARRSLALLGVASGPVDRRRLPAVLELERAGLVERRSGGVLPCNRLVARAALEHLADDERRDVLRRAASLPGTAEVARAELLERAGEHAAALEVAEVLAAGPILRSEQARALLVAARAATELCRSEDGPRVAAERASELSVRAAAALNDCNDHDAAAEVLGEVDDHTGPRRDAAVLEALRAAVGRGDRTYAEHVVATTAAALDGLPAQVARRAGALRSMVDRWRGERSEHDDLPALARAHLEVARGGTERSHAAMLVAVTAYGRDVGTMEEWFRVARAEAARDGELSSELSAARNLVMVKMAVGRIAEGRELARECTARAEAAAEAGWALEFRTLDVLGRYYDDGDQDEVLSWLSYVRTAPVRLETRAYSANALATALADRGDARRSAEVLAPWLEPGRMEGFDPIVQGIVSWAAAQRAWILGDLVEVVRRASWVTERIPAGFPTLAGTQVAWRWAEYELGVPITAPTPCGGFTESASLEARALDLLVAGEPRRAAGAFDEAAASWRPILRRAWHRCRWGAGHALAVAGDEAAALEVLEDLDRDLVRCGFAALRPRVHASIRLARGRTPVEGRGRRRVAPGTGAAGPLTPREREVLGLVGDGLTSREIARRLGVAPATIDSHVRSAVHKLGVRTRREAAAVLRRQADAR